MEPADGWVISNRPAHPALVSEDDFAAAQDVNAARGPVLQDEPVLRRYLLAGLLACGVCPGEVIGYVRAHEITLTWNPAAAALQARATQTGKTVTVGTR